MTTAPVKPRRRRAGRPLVRIQTTRHLRPCPREPTSCPALPPSPPTHLRAPHHRAPQDGTTGLFLASQNGHLEAVRLLLESRADVSLADEVP